MQIDGLRISQGSFLTHPTRIRVGAAPRRDVFSHRRGRISLSSDKFKDVGAAPAAIYFPKVTNQYRISPASIFICRSAHKGTYLSALGNLT